ncbi:MAG: hypothetical protein QM831_16505 [Kofleriaceae bacterium]
MRVGILPLLGVAGCNSIFGLNPGVATDAYLDSTAPRTNIKLVTMQWSPGATMASYGDAANISYGAIPTDMAPNPTIVQQAAESSHGFSVEFSISQIAYRVMWIPSDGVPVEAQGAFVEGSVLVAETTYADNFAATAPPSNALISGPSPSDMVNGSFSNMRWMVFGSTWEWHYFPPNTPVGRVTGGTNYTLDPTAAGGPYSVGLGKLFVPKATDRFIGLSTQSTAQADPTMDVYWRNDIAGFDGSGLQTPNTQGASAKLTTVAKMKVALQPSDNTIQTIIGVHGAASMKRDDTNIPTAFGVMPSTAITNFFMPGNYTASTPDAPTDQHNLVYSVNAEGGMSQPMFVPMAFGNAQQFTYIDLFDGTIAPAFQKAVLGRAGYHRTSNGVLIDEGVQKLSLLDTGTDADPKTTIDLSGKVMATAMSLNGVDIFSSTGGENAVIPVPKGAVIALKYGIDLSAADDCMTTVYEINGANLVAKKRYLQAIKDGPTINISADTFDPLKQYVIGMKCHDGYGGDLAVRDWTSFSYPFSEGVTYSLSFQVQ